MSIERIMNAKARIIEAENEQWQQRAEAAEARAERLERDKKSLRQERDEYALEITRLNERIADLEAADAREREKDARIAELEKDRDLNMEMYKSAWKKYASCANALSFYAKRIHWIGLTEDAEVETVLVAMQGPSPCHGWSVAERALSAPSQTYEARNKP